MTAHDRRRDPWSIPIVLLWCVYFLVGLDPELTFDTLRGLGNVVTQRAMVNSPHLITLALAGFLAMHVYQRCIEAGLSKPDAQARALQSGVLGLAAFLNFPLIAFLNFASQPTQDQRLLVLGVGIVKYTVWFYLLAGLIRYHMSGQRRVYSGMVSVFPSTYGPNSGNGARARPTQSDRKAQDGAAANLAERAPAADREDPAGQNEP